MTREVRCAAAEEIVREQRRGALTNNPESVVHTLEQAMRTNPDDLKGASWSALNHLLRQLSDLQAAVMGDNQKEDTDGR